MYEQIPEELRSLKSWGLYKRIWQPEKNKYTKIPYSALTGTKTSSTEPGQWVTFDEALQALSAYSLDGLGFFFGNGYVGIDVDHIGADLDRMYAGDVTDNVAWEFMSGLKSYTELSMSKTGIHIIIKGKIPGDRRRKGNVEMYESGRFFAMTGNRIGAYLTVNSPDLKPLYTKYLEPRSVISLPNSKAPQPNNLSADEIIAKMLSSRTGERINLLLNGGWEQFYTSQSEADIALANDLAFWTGRDFSRMDEIFRGSSLMREKWDEKRGKTTYGVATLNKAINDTSSVYHPERERPKYDLGFITDSGKPKALKPHSWDDTGNADRFVDRYGKVARYSFIDKGWYIYNGAFWELDQRGLLRTMIDNTVADLKNEKPYTPPDVDPDKAEKEWAKFCKTSRGNRGKRAMEDELQHRLPVTTDEFDADQSLMNVDNGYIDLSDGTLHEHDIKKMFSKQSTVEYSDKVDCPEWQAFLKQTFNGDKELTDYIQKAVGYSLTGSVEEQVMFILYGSGRNGKSVFMDTLKHIAGSYSRTMQAKSIMVQQTSGGANSDIARLKGARLVSASEPNEGVRLDEGLIKELTGGESVTARFLYGREFEFKPEFKLWLSTNHKPIIRGTDDGIWRRLMLIPFTHQVPVDQIDKRLTYKLERESIGILNWAVDGALKWQREGLQPPQSVRDASLAYRNEMDVLELFVNDCCEKGPDYEAPAGQLYDTYVKWAESTGEYKMRKQKFGAEMQNKFEYARQRDGRKYVGLRMKTDSRLNWANV